MVNDSTQKTRAWYVEGSEIVRIRQTFVLVGLLTFDLAMTSDSVKGDSLSWEPRNGQLTVQMVFSWTSGVRHPLSGLISGEGFHARPVTCETITVGM